jgi:hypothetical protein
MGPAFDSPPLAYQPWWHQDRCTRSKLSGLEMISQISLDGNTLWHPNYTSFLSEAAFLGFSSGGSTKWSNGRMIFNDPEAVEDAPYFKGISRYYEDQAALEWVRAVLDVVDQILPEDDVLLQAFDEFSLNVSAEPAAFRIPQIPSSDDVALCLVAARCLIRLKDDVVFPVSHSMKDAVADLRYASELCVIIGGEKSILTAMSWLQDDRTYRNV